jgi:hypothetical protein
LGFNYSGMRILSGHYETVLVVGVTKRSEAPPVMGVKGVFGPGSGFQEIFQTIEKAVG